MKSSLLKYTAALLVVFALSIAGRYSYDAKVLRPNGQAPKEFNNGNVNNYYSSGEFDFSLRNNYASYKQKSDLGPPPGAHGMQIGFNDQKYEKVANIGARSQHFTDDETSIRSLVEQHQSQIQFEQLSGLAGSRQLRLAIGVPPDEFDAFVLAAKSIGEILNIQIDKTDKTNEYRDLIAKRKSLQDHLDALTALKNKSADMNAQLNLEREILSINKQILDLGVSLGEFDSENEFCTVKFNIKEHNPYLFNIGNLERLADAFWFVTTIFASVLFVIACGLVGIYVLLKVIATTKEMANR